MYSPPAAFQQTAPPSSPQDGINSVPPYYVALTTTKQLPPEEYATAQVRATATGAVIATVVPPKPYVAFTGVTAAADDRTFVLSTGDPAKPGGFSSTRAGFFVLHIAPGRPARGGAASLRALSAGFVPANTSIQDMALSPDGHSLATDLGNVHGFLLSVFNLVTGTKRTWSGSPVCIGHCLPVSGGLGTGGVNVDALSWTADGRKIAFFWDGQIRLLDTAKPGTNMLANSKLIVQPPNVGAGDFQWCGAIITPDGRTVVAVEELSTQGPPVTVSQRLVTFSAATGVATATLNNPNMNWAYEQVLWTNASGSVLVVYGARGSESLGILHAGKYTPIASSARIVTAAW
jgi:hypothetical protein